MNFKDLKTEITPTPKSQKPFKNLTSRYLLPQVALLGDEFMSRLNESKWAAFGLCDHAAPTYQMYDEYDNKIFMLAHNNSNLTYWMNNYEYYLYQDGEANKTMIIVDLPINNRNAFLAGDYSKLYSKTINDRIIPKIITYNNIEFISSSWNVTNKTAAAKEDFEKRLLEDFNTEINLEESSEYEYPPMMEREIFNYGQLFYTDEIHSSSRRISDDNSYGL